MLQPCYKVATDLRPFVVAGKLLAPFTLYHWRTLDALDSPFIGGGPISIPDIVIFLAICMMRNRSEIDELLTGDFEKELSDLTRGISDIDNAETCTDVKAYLDYYRDKPVRESPKENTPCRAPVWGMLKSYLVEFCGYTNIEAWDCIVAEGYCEVAFHSSRREDETLTDEVTLARRLSEKDMVVPTQEELKARMHGGKQ